MKQNKLSICLNGATQDTSNLGVSALCVSTLSEIFKHASDSEVTVFDYGTGIREASINVSGSNYNYKLRGAHYTHRLYREESFFNMYLNSLLNLKINSIVKLIHYADAVLDITGGDSFTDLYGLKRFYSASLPKLIAIKENTPLILLPQTYGPFFRKSSKRIAKKIVRGATMAWARDGHSFEILREMLGEEFDPVRHRLGVDMAFALKPVPVELTAELNSLFDGNDKKTIVGFNVSGLIYNDPVSAVKQYGFKADYKKIVFDFIDLILNKSDAEILLLPHVLSQEDQVESDVKACLSVAKKFAKTAGDRIKVLPANYDQSQIKWIISKCSWFCGTRMHSTIAALSSSVPTAAIAYSDKTKGVFETCGQGEQVSDPRKETTENIVEKLYLSFLSRESTRIQLSKSVKPVIQQAENQMSEILGVISNK